MAPLTRGVWSFAHHGVEENLVERKRVLMTSRGVSPREVHGVQIAIPRSVKNGNDQTCSLAPEGA